MVLNNVKIVLSDCTIDKGYIKTLGGKIVEVGEEGYKHNDDEILDKTGLIAMPGFIDIHTHGGVGEDFMETNKEGVLKIANSYYQEGITSFLATTLTSDQKSLVNACKVISEAAKENPSILGIHLEGPYISVKFKGAQNEAYIRNPNKDELDELISASNNLIKNITLAPEKEGSVDFIKYATSKGINVSVGHSDASFNDVKNAIDAGARSTTHTHNAMSGHHHRNPGVVTAAMYFNELFTEVIMDGIHVCDNTVKTFYKIVGEDRFMIITDSLKVKHYDLPTFKLFGLDCETKNGAAYLTSGPLAGSILSFDQGVRNMKEWTNASLSELAKVSSLNQARLLNLNDRGEIAPSKRADIVLLDESLHVKETYVVGKKVF